MKSKEFLNLKSNLKLDKTDMYKYLEYKNELLKICKDVNYLDRQIKANNRTQEKTR